MILLHLFIRAQTDLNSVVLQNNKTITVPERTIHMKTPEINPISPERLILLIKRSQLKHKKSEVRVYLIKLI